MSSGPVEDWSRHTTCCFLHSQSTFPCPAVPLEKFIWALRQSWPSSVLGNRSGWISSYHNIQELFTICSAPPASERLLLRQLSSSTICRRRVRYLGALQTLINLLRSSRVPPRSTSSLYATIGVQGGGRSFVSVGVEDSTLRAY